MKPILTLLFGGILLSHSVHAGETVIGVRTLQIPDGFEVVLAADPSLVAATGVLTPVCGAGLKARFAA